MPGSLVLPGVRPPRSGPCGGYAWTPEQEQWIAREYRAGRTAGAIGAAAGVQKQTILRTLRRLGVRIRPPRNGFPRAPLRPETPADLFAGEVAGVYPDPALRQYMHQWALAWWRRQEETCGETR